MRYLTLFIFIFLAQNAHAGLRSSLSGKITDTAGNPLPGAVIELPDLHTGTVSDANGSFSISDLPGGNFLYSIKLLGYESKSGMIALNGATALNVKLAEAVLEQREVVVTGTSAATEQRRSSFPIQSITAKQMREQASTNVIDAITRLPGVQQLSTGPAISKPIIRGLGYNRIITLSDGIRQEGQQWGDEHGIEIDDYNVSRVEVLKGPASLSYGSDALAGVINIITEEPAQPGKIMGKVLTNYQTNNGQAAIHAGVSGNNKGIIWSAYYTGKRAHDYQNPYDGYVFNTRYKNNDYGATIGINRHWFSTKLAFTAFQQGLGIAEGTRDSITGRFVKEVDNSGTPETVLTDDADGRSFSQELPRQQINHYKLASASTFYLDNGSRIGITLGGQRNVRREFDNVLQPDAAGLFLQLQTFTYNLHYLFAINKVWSMTTGINGMQQSNKNLGEEFLVPDYQLNDIGGYLIAKRDWKRWALSAGIRVDRRSLTTETLAIDSNGERVNTPQAGGYTRFATFSRQFAAPSGSVGASYNLNEKTTFRFNAASGFRAPNIAELSANGVHEGAIRYEYGNADLRSEQSFQADLGAEYHSEHLSVNAAIFLNNINNYTYVRKLNNQSGSDSIPALNNDEGFPAFLFAQTSARLFGGELYMDYHHHPLDWLHFENTFSYVQGRSNQQTDSTRWLPAMPQPRWIVALRAQKRQLGKHIANAFVKLELDNNFAQNQAYTAYATETASPAYSLWNASLGFDLVSRGITRATLSMAAQNLGDTGYQNHLSRLRFADTNYQTGRTGIFGMGRNISIGLSVPLYLK